MIFVDSRLGSKDLAQPLQRLGLEVELTTLDYGDIAFEGRGEKGAAVSIGIEFKKFEELVAGLRSERLQGYQMVGMRDTYDYSYLFIEGVWRYDRIGALLRVHRKPMAGRMTISELLKRTFVLHLCGGLTPWWTANRRDTLESIVALYRTWTDRDLDQHKSHLAIYNAPSLVPISDLRNTLRTLPGIGMKASKAVEEHFGGSLQAAMNAGVEEWASIQTKTDTGRVRRLGTQSAERICNYIRGAK